MKLTDRLKEITAAADAAIRASGIPDAELVTVANTGVDFLNARSPAAGGVIVYPFPQLTLPAPRGIRRVVWTIGLLAGGRSVDAAARCDELLEVLTGAGIIAWRAAAAEVRPTDFAVSEDPNAPKIPGWAITITEEWLP